MFKTYGKPSVCCNTTYSPNDTSDHTMLPGFNPYSKNVELEVNRDMENVTN